MGGVHERPGASGARDRVLTARVAALRAYHYILVVTSGQASRSRRSSWPKRTSALVCAYLGLHPTISIKEETPDAARTQAIEALDSSQLEAAAPASTRRGT